MLSEAARKLLGERPECCKKVSPRRRGAFEGRLLPSLASEATRKFHGKRVECCKSLPPGQRGAFAGRLLPNVATKEVNVACCSH